MEQKLVQLLEESQRVQEQLRQDLKESQHAKEIVSQHLEESQSIAKQVQSELEQERLRAIEAEKERDRIKKERDSVQQARDEMEFHHAIFHMHSIDKSYATAVEECLPEATRLATEQCSDFYENQKKMNMDQFFSMRLVDLDIEPKDSISQQSSQQTCKPPSLAHVPSNRWTRYKIPELNPILLCDESEFGQFVKAIANVMAGMQLMKQLHKTRLFLMHKFPESKIKLQEVLHYQQLVSLTINGIMKAFHMAWRNCRKSFPDVVLKVDSWQDFVTPGGIPDSVILAKSNDCPESFDPCEAIGVVEIKKTKKKVRHAAEHQTMIYHASLLNARKKQDIKKPVLAITTNMELWSFAIADNFSPDARFAVAMTLENSPLGVAVMFWAFKELFERREIHGTRPIPRFQTCEESDDEEEIRMKNLFLI
jgi:hypothetical protein